VVQGYVVSRPAASTSSAAIGSRAGGWGHASGEACSADSGAKFPRGIGPRHPERSRHVRQITDRLARRIATIAGVDAIEVKSECLCA